MIRNWIFIRAKFSR